MIKINHTNERTGPSRTNRRKDGELGGIVVEKCKFLQESGCKGLCLHQCKLPVRWWVNRRGRMGRNGRMEGNRRLGERVKIDGKINR